jgi:hypothetical protein
MSALLKRLLPLLAVPHLAWADSVQWSNSYSFPGTNDIAMCSDGWLWRIADSGNSYAPTLQYSAPPYTSWVTTSTFGGPAVDLTCNSTWSMWTNRLMWYTRPYDDEIGTVPSRLESMWYYYPGAFYNYALHASPAGAVTDIDLISGAEVFDFRGNGQGRPGNLGVVPDLPATQIAWAPPASLHSARLTAGTTWNNNGVLFALNDDKTLWVNFDTGGTWNLGPGPGWHPIPDPTFALFGGLVTDMEATTYGGQIQLWVLISTGSSRTVHRVNYIP